MRRDRSERRLHSKPRQVFDDRLVEVELALFAQLQQRERQKGFRDRADLKQLVGLEPALPIEIAEAVGRDPLHAVAIREDQRHPGTLHVAHELLDEAIELGEYVVVLRRGRGESFLDPETTGGGGGEQ